jgi:hypothetical protein
MLRHLIPFRSQETWNLQPNNAKQRIIAIIATIVLIIFTVLTIVLIGVSTYYETLSINANTKSEILIGNNIGL